MGCIRCVRRKKLQRDFVGRTFLLIALVQYVLHQLLCTYKTIPMHQNTTNCTKTLVYCPTGWIGRVRCKKSKRDIVARTFTLIAPVHYVLQQVSCSYETIPNAPKYYETDRNISLGSNGVDGLRWLRKITMRLCGTNFCINYTSSVCFATSFMQLRNDPKCTQTL